MKEQIKAREDLERCPRDPATDLPLAPRAQPGYYLGYSTLQQAPHWDEATRAVIEARVFDIPPCRYFTEKEQSVMKAVLECVMPQSDRDSSHRIPLLNMIDQKLFEKKFDGYVYEGRPDDDVVHRLGLAAIEATAQEVYKQEFAILSLIQQEAILISARDEKPIGAQKLWREVSGKHYWNVLMQDASSAYYAHPFAWDEIGFGGPAYPRGYIRLTEGQAEPWEKDEGRYAWSAPAGSRSDQFKNNENVLAGAQ